VVVGAGALGSHAASGLVRAGVGRLRVVDRDYVEWSNLARQDLFDEEDVRGLVPKAVAAEIRLARINSDVRVEGVVADLSGGNAEELLAGFDVITDGTDNFETRFLVNDFAIKHSVPYVYGACVGSSGAMMVVAPGEGPCLRCVFEEPPPPGSFETCETAGILGSTAAVVAACQVVEAMKILAGLGAEVTRDLVELDVWEGSFRRIDTSKARRADCPACGGRRFDWLESDRAGEASKLCGRGAVQIPPARGAGTVNLEALGRRLESAGRAVSNEYLVRLEADGYTITVFRDGRAIVVGAKSESEARSAHARFIGA